jgi:Sulfotransferase family
MSLQRRERMTSPTPIDVLSISAAMAETAPVFILGIPRSGTSVLRFTLARLPAFRGKDEKAAETFVFVRPESVARVLEPDGRRLLRYFFGDEAAATALVASLARIPDGGGAIERDANARDRAAAWCAANRHHRLRAFFHFASAARGVRRILEKTPTHVHYVPEIRATFPRAKFLFCLRHPVEAFASFRKRLASEEQRGRKDEKLEWLRVSVGRFCGDFTKVVRDIDAALATDPSCGLVVDYADLTERPGPTFERVCSLLGENFDAELLLGAKSEVRAADGTPQPEGRVVANRSEWSKHVTRDEAAEIENRLAPLFERFGYSRLAE